MSEVQAPPEIPEFEITVRYRDNVDGWVAAQPAPSAEGTAHLYARGWRYSVRYEDSKGQERVHWRNGFLTEEQAIEAAKARAKKAAMAVTGVRTFKYTPTLED
jgi:hypothetical protein